MPLHVVLKLIQNKYDIKVAYANQQLENVFIDAIIQNATVEECFKQILENTLLESTTVEERVIIAPRPIQAGKPTRVNFTISGIVVDEKNGETLPNVYITLPGTNLGCFTNKDGCFAILQVPTDTAIINVQYLGYSTQSISLSHVDDPLHIKIKLRDEIKILNMVMVSDAYNQALQIDNETSKIAFNPKTLRSLPSLGEQDVFRTMQLMPGVGGTDESSAGMNIRGMNSSENLILLDGITIYQLDHFFGAFSILNSDIIKDVRVYKGGFDAKYGGRVSGVIDITSKNGNGTKPVVKVGSNFISVSGSAEIPISPKLSLMFAGRRSYTDKVQSNLFEKLYNVGNRTTDQIRKFSTGQFNSLKPSYYFYDTNFKLSYKPTKKDIVSFSVYNSADHLMVDDTVGRFSISHPHEYTHWTNAGLSIRWARQWNEKIYTNVRFAGSQFIRRYEFSNAYRSNVAGDSTVVYIKNNVRDLTLIIDNEWLVNDMFSVEFGFSNLYHRIQDDVANEMFLIKKNSFQAALLNTVYGTLIAKLSDRFQISAGLRLNKYCVLNSLYQIDPLMINFLTINFTASSELYTEPRINLHYFITKKVKLKAALAKNNQFVSQVIVNDYTGDLFDINNNFWILADGTRNIPVIGSNHYVLGTTFQTNGFVFDCEFFYKGSSGIIDNKLRDGRGITRGMDIMLQKSTGIYKGWVSYSLSESRESFSSFQNGKFFPTLYDQRHELKVVNMLAWKNLNFSTNWIYGSGRPYPTYTIDITPSGVKLIRDYSNVQRLQSYHRLDIAISYKFALGKYMQLETGISIFNVYNNRNIKTKKVDRAYTTGNNYKVELPPYLDVKLLDFTPSLFLNISL